MARDLDGQEQMLLMGLALGTRLINWKREYRFRHMTTGEVKDRLDLRTDNRDEWITEHRNVVTTNWENDLL